jgi:uncharacterized protein YjbJ (UPF0337 family)
MNRNEIAGKARQLKGAAKSRIGAWLGNDQLTVDGAVDSVTGRAQERLGVSQRTIAESVKKAERLDSH